jgi:hypothetical protein
VVSGSYECLKTLLKPAKQGPSDAIEIELHPDSKEPSSTAHDDYARVLFYRAARVRQLRNVSHALRVAESDAAAWTTLGQTLLEIDRIGRYVIQRLHWRLHTKLIFVKHLHGH